MAYARSLVAGASPGPGAPPKDPNAADRLFLLERRPGRLRINAFSNALQALFGIDQDVLKLMSLADQGLVAALADSVLAAEEPGVLQAVAETGTGVRLGLEITLAPLATDLAGPGRVLGYVQPLGGEPFLDSPATRMTLLGLSPPRAKPERRLRLVVSNP